MRLIVSLSAFAAASLAVAAHAESWDYAAAGTANADVYSFRAAADGTLKAYFMPSTGSYRSALGVKVNGATVGRGAMPLGQTDNFVPLNFGPVHAGDAIEFFIDVTLRDAAATPMGTYFSDVAHNADGVQHVYVSHHFDQWYLGPEGVPDGAFIAFEDTTTGDPNGDLNYRDYTFVVPNLIVGPAIALSPLGDPLERGDDALRPAVPEPASWAMMLAGFGAVGAGLRRRRRLAFA